MTRRAAAREETRRRIVEATAKLHGERGVLGTSWQDIAREADVAVATVYKHFPSLAELLPACGALVMERARPPRPERAAELLAGTRGVAERLRRVADELFAYYERGGAHLEVDVRERNELPGMREWEERQRAMVAAFVREALRPAGAAAGTVRLASAFLDLPAYRALRERRIGRERAARAAAQAAAAVVSMESARGE